jgi:hypothetical protein
MSMVARVAEREIIRLGGAKIEVPIQIVVPAKL